MTSLIISYESNNEFKPNLLNSLHWLSKAWQTGVSQRTIVNCFRSAGFIKQHETAIEHIPQPFEQINLETDNIFERLRIAYGIPESVSFTDYCSADSTVVTSMFLFTLIS
jgi:hypothetical protein